MNPRRTYTITRLDQIRALASPLRQELLDALARLGTVSLREVAAVLGRPADGLYYHVRILQRVGLLKAAHPMTRGGRQELMIRAKAPEFALRYAPSPASKARAVNAVVAAMLRLGTRDFRRALAQGDVRTEGPDRELWAIRTAGWLAPAHIRRINRLILELKAAATHTRAKGRLYGITVLLTPLHQRRSGTERRPRRDSRR